MAVYSVDYSETYMKNYLVVADSKEEAEECVRIAIGYGDINPPEECSDTECSDIEIVDISEDCADAKVSDYPQIRENMKIEREAEMCYQYLKDNRYVDDEDKWQVKRDIKTMQKVIPKMFNLLKNMSDR